MFIPRILILFECQAYRKFLVIVSCPVNYNYMVKIHIMAKLICMLSNFKNVVSNTDVKFCILTFDDHDVTG